MPGSGRMLWLAIGVLAVPMGLALTACTSVGIGISLPLPGGISIGVGGSIPLPPPKAPERPYRQRP